MSRQIKLLPSILTADLMNLGRDIDELAKGGADMLHLDIMDGNFAPNITLGFDFIKAAAQQTDMPVEAHLMVQHPEDFIDVCVEKGADFITVHVEACKNLQSTLAAIRKAGRKAGMALNPATPESEIEHVLGEADLILAMSVNPGYGGQKFISTVTQKIANIRQMLDSRGIPADIAVDGGMNETTIPLVCEAGVTMIVVGSYLVKSGADLAAEAEEVKALFK